MRFTVYLFVLIAVFNPLLWKGTGRKQVWRVCFLPWPTSYLSNMKRKIGRRMGWRKITIFLKFMGLPYTDLSGRVPLHRPYHVTWQLFYIMVLLNMKIKPYFNSISTPKLINQQLKNGVKIVNWKKKVSYCFFYCKKYPYLKLKNKVKIVNWQK